MSHMHTAERVLIVGGSSGMGLALAERLLTAGADITIVGRLSVGSDGLPISPRPSNYSCTAASSPARCSTSTEANAWFKACPTHPGRRR